MGKDEDSTRWTARSWNTLFMKKTKPRKVSAWLVTREWVADYPRKEVVAIFSPRLGGGRVREFVDLLDVTTLRLSEQATIMWP